MESASFFVVGGISFEMIKFQPLINFNYTRKCILVVLKNAWEYISLSWKNNDSSL